MRWSKPRPKLSQTHFAMSGYLGTCPNCARERIIRKRRLNTAYTHDEDNWVECCSDCYQMMYEYYEERWEEYYSMCLGTY